MRLGALRLRGFRSYADATFEFHHTINLIVGANASGKTSLLEAIHYLAYLQSFRTSIAGHLIRTGEERFLINHRGPDGSTLGILYARGRHQTRLNGSAVLRRSQLLRHFPLCLLHPGCYALLDQGPIHRRRFIDQVLFHVEHDYHRVLLQFRHLLRQRNASLRNGEPALARSWDQALSDLAATITTHRMQFVSWLSVNQHRSPLFSQFQGLEFRLHPGWSEPEPLSVSLSRELGQDLKLRQTRKGPHKADLSFLIDGVPARQSLSRGQGKLFLLHLHMLCLLYLQEHAAVSPLFLLDELGSELDLRGLVLALDALIRLAELPCQVVLTTTRPEIEPLLRQRLGEDLRVFHVEQGEIRKVV